MLQWFFFASVDADAAAFQAELATSRSSIGLGRSGSLPLRSVVSLGGAAEEEEFHDAVEDMEKSLRVELEVLLGTSSTITATRSAASAAATTPDSPTAAAAAAAVANATAADAAAASAAAAGASPKATLAVTSLPVELHWRQQSLRRILQTLELYRDTIRGRVQQHLDELSEASAAAVGPRGLLSKETVAAVHDTLQTVQQTLSFGADGEGVQGGAADTQRTSSSSSSKSRASSSNAQLLRTASSGRDWLRTGLYLGGVLPPLAIHRCCDATWKAAQDGAAAAATGGETAEGAGAAGTPGGTEHQQHQKGLQHALHQQMPHVGLELTLTFREFAIAFWETNDSVLARMALKELRAFSRFYSNGDTETTFAIGDGGVVFRDRCVLAPRAAYRPPAQHQPRRAPHAAAQTAARPGATAASSSPRACDTAAAPAAVPAAAVSVAEAGGAPEGAGSAGAEEGKDAPSGSLFTARVRQYGGPDPISGAPLPYSICLEGQMEQICFVYRQQDVSRTLNYLRDGIFDVFISKSYRAVREAATASYCLFALDIQSPLFILAEDKEAIPGYVPPPGYRVPKKRLGRTQKQSAAAPVDAGPAAGPAAPTGRTAAVAATDPSQMEVEASHLGRFIVFDLGNLKVHNAYVPAVSSHHPHHVPQQQEQQQQQNEFLAAGLLRPPSFGDHAFVSMLSEGDRVQAAGSSGEWGSEGAQGEVVCSDLRLEMRGMQISASDNTQEAAAGGCLLENVEARLLLRSAPNSLSIEAETTAWLLHLSRQQLTLVLDVINENIGGQGYRPAAEVLPVPASPGATPAPAAAGDSSTSGSVGGCVDEAALRRELETPPLAVECHIVIPQLTLEASFGSEAPLALLSLHRITAKVAASVSRLLSCYRFLLCAEEFSIDDLRTNSANYFKRVAHCTAPGAAESCCSGDTYYGDSTCCSRDSSWCGDAGDSQGNEESDGSEAVDTLQSRSNRAPAVQFEFGSSLRESYMEFQFSGVTIYLLLVAFMDILSYFTSSWAFSSMRSYPKPLPTLLKNAEHQQQHQQQQRQQQAEGEKRSREASGGAKATDNGRGDAISLLLSGEALRERPFRVSVNIQRGCFVVYSALQSAAAPIIVWSSDFLVDLSMKGDEIAFERVEVLGSKICRFNAAPLHAAPLRSRSRAAQDSPSTGACSMEKPPGPTVSFDAATEEHRPDKHGSADARTVRWGSTDSSSSSSNRYGCSFESTGLPSCVRQQSAGTAAEANWKQQERPRQQQMMRDWTQLQQLQQLQQLVSGGGPAPDRLAPSTDPSSAVLLCEQFHLEGRGVYRSTTVAPDDASEPKQPQQQQQGHQDATSATPRRSHGRVPAAVHRMQQAFSAAAAKLPPSSISAPGGRRAPPLSSGPTAAARRQQQQQQHTDVGTDGALSSVQQQRREQQQGGKHRSDQEGVQQQKQSTVAGEREEVGAKAQNRVLTFIDLSFDIPRTLGALMLAL